MNAARQNLSLEHVVALKAPGAAKRAWIARRCRRGRLHVMPLWKLAY